MRYQRSSIIEAMSSAYIRTARSKGLSERDVLVHHAFRNALLPIVTLLGLEPAGARRRRVLRRVRVLDSGRRLPDVLVDLRARLSDADGDHDADGGADRARQPARRHRATRSSIRGSGTPRCARCAVSCANARPSPARSSSLLLVLAGGLRAVPRHDAAERRSIHALIGLPAAAVGRALVRHRPDRPRRVHARALRRARLAARRRRGHGRVVRDRHPLRRDRRCRRRHRRQPDDALRRRDALVPDVLLAADRRRR